MKTLLRKYTPKTLWKGLAMGRNWMLDGIETVLGRRGELVPPRRLIFIGSGDFQKIGDEFLGYFKDLAGLKPDDRVLDVGCGIGRMAIPLTRYLSEKGGYDGFDIVPRGIQWCTDHITPRYPQFRFHLADIRNEEYNPQGRITAGAYRFPFADETFDVVFLTSVFTHMLSEEVGHYLSEISRVMKPGGRCLITWFLLHPESENLLGQGRSALDFRHPVDQGLTTNAAVPEEAVAYRQAFVLSLYEKHGLTIRQPVRYGSWCGRPEYLSFQDICIASKPAA